MSDLQNADLWVKIVSGIITSIAFGVALVQYLRSRIDLKAKQFLELRNYFRGNERFQNIVEHLHTDNDFSTVTWTDRIEFMGFYEEIAFLVKSGLLKKEVAYYMFGSDAIRAYNNDAFWEPRRRTEENWGLLTEFVRKMEKIDDGFKFSKFRDRIRIQGSRTIFPPLQVFSRAR